MRKAPRLQRHRAIRALASAMLAVLSMTIALPVAAQEATAEQETPLLMLRPHCEEEAPAEVPGLVDFLKNGVGTCKNFPIRDPQTQETSTVKTGDTLDFDVIVYNPAGKKIERVRAWLSYDSQVLEGKQITLGEALPILTPGEADFSAEEGFAKIAASADADKQPESPIVVVARIQFTVLKSPTGGQTPMAFYDQQPGVQGHTFVATKVGEEEQNILTGAMGSLLVLVEADASGSAGSTSSAATDGSASSDASSPSEASTGSASSGSSQSSEERTAFVLLQVQNVRVGTEGSSAYVAWDQLRSSELAGYNVYYGTERGRYIHRHSVAPENTSFVIRGLMTGVVQYFAVRGVNVRNEESAFSQEVAVKVGDPKTSTSPLPVTPGQDLGPDGKNPLERYGTPEGSDVPGETGTSSVALIILVSSAIAGTGFAFRRHLLPQKRNMFRSDTSDSPFRL